jgi:hypothetical protein
MTEMIVHPHVVCGNANTDRHFSVGGCEEHCVLIPSGKGFKFSDETYYYWYVYSKGLNQGGGRVKTFKEAIDAVENRITEMLNTGLLNDDNLDDDAPKYIQDAIAQHKKDRRGREHEIPTVCLVVA